MNLTFITSNEGKLKQLKQLLDYPVSHQKIDVPEIQSLDLHEVATAKAKAAYEQVGSPVLVEDTSLTFHALGSLPGPLIKWFRQSLGDNGLVKLLSGANDRSATAAVCFALCDERGVQLFDSSIAGTIASEPRGDRGFGWDPIFIPDGHDQTWGEIDPAGEVRLQMRRVALEKLQRFLATHN